MLTRRRLIQFSALAPFVNGSRSFAAEAKLSHAVSLFGDVKYPADFKSFDYVNATAPKGGKWRQAVVGSFDSLNDYTVKGDGAGIGILDTLMAASSDEPATRYALIAEAISYPEDKSSVTFKLNPAARFHDGKPITVEDVIFSMETLKSNLPNYAAYYKNVVKMEKTGEREVTFTFDEKNNRELPSIVSELPILPKHWWQSQGPDGKARNTNEPTMELPLGSGPYKFKSAAAGATVVLERVQDYWAKDLPSQIGQNNFDEMAYTFYQTPQVAFESFKAGDSDYRVENSSKQWATGYDFPAAQDGRIVKAAVVLKQVRGMQAYVLNLRRPKFQDVRVRRAMLLAFDFQWANANLFYGIYQQSRSFFNGSEFEAKGLPSSDELELLIPLKDKLPPEVFTTEYQNPVNGDGTARRKNLREATQLLSDAGWTATDVGGKRVLKNAKGEILSIDFALDSPLFERITLPYKEQLELLGFVVSIRTLDPAQMKKIQDQFDYDIMVNVFAQSLSPGNEQRFFWGSAEADKQGSQNYAGIKNEAIDALIEKLVFVKDRQALVTACRALDRTLMWNFYMVPQWFSPADRIAYWDRFGQPEKSPDYVLPAPTTWWFDEAKAKKISG
ncbi:MAG: extracellular solute-binding protein [Aestuariivirga sp.]